jgi:methylated-DNA-[protein]-cysteine S-methyltransferase
MRAGRAGLPAETRHVTPFAVLSIVTDGTQVTGIRYLPRSAAPRDPHDRVAERACREIERYIADPEYRFAVPYRLHGTPFQQRVWREIEKIFPLKTISYGVIAARLQSSARAVGGACGANPVPLIVPCHRVLAVGGRLGGFMGGRKAFPLAVKRWLLRHEGILTAAD